MSEILEFLGDGETRHVSYISTLAIDSVDFYVGGLDPSPVYRLSWSGKLLPMP